MTLSQSSSSTTPSRSDCISWDQNDVLMPMRDQFTLPPETIYLDGNSLGALPKTTAEQIQITVEQHWGRDLITSWNSHDWINLPQRISTLIAPLIGAKPEQVIACDSTSINLFKLVTGALKTQAKSQAKSQSRRTKIISERCNFPTDIYILQGIIELFDGAYQLQLCDRDELAAAIDQETAIVVLTHVDYRSGELWNMAELTHIAHQQGALIVWDLAHSAGAMPLTLNDCGVDLAIGCGYKYLNGGPGAPAFLYVAEHLVDRLPAVLSGWMGHAKPFDFALDYQPDAGIKRFTCGTPSVIGMIALEQGVQLFAQANLAAIRHKSQRLGDLFLDLVLAWLADTLTIACPTDSNKRGSQVSLSHPQGYAIMQALIDRGIIGDFRTPDILRFGFAPLYVRYVDIWDTVAQLRDIMTTRAWDQPQFKVRAQVT